MGWEDSTRKALLGPVVQLKATNDECYVRAKKLPTRVTDEIADIQATVQRTIRAGGVDRVQKIRDLAAEVEAGNRKPTEEEAALVLEIAPNLPTDYRTNLMRLAIQHGVGEHNFTNGDGKPLAGGKAFDAETVEAILQWGDLAEEIFKSVMAWNRPLPKGSVEK